LARGSGFNGEWGISVLLKDDLFRRSLRAVLAEQGVEEDADHGFAAFGAGFQDARVDRQDLRAARGGIVRGLAGDFRVHLGACELAKGVRLGAGFCVRIDFILKKFSYRSKTTIRISISN